MNKNLSVHPYFTYPTRSVECVSDMDSKHPRHLKADPPLPYSTHTPYYRCVVYGMGPGRRDRTEQKLLLRQGLLV